MSERKDEIACSACGKKFSSREALDQHRKDAHSGKKAKKSLSKAVVIVAIIVLAASVIAYSVLQPVTKVVRVNHVRGNESAPVTILEFSDFQCPYCARAEPTLEQILNDYDGKVRLVYKHFIVHATSEKAAEASECAGEQGKFWEYHDLLFQNQANQRAEDLKNYAIELGMNTTSFNSCLDNGIMSQRVKADVDEALGRGVEGTPTFFINGERFYGVTQNLYHTFAFAINKSLGVG